jgi:NAD(P)-dependent dehydrogenase (short-subunit alcohol dehydrogenase family)
MMELASKTAFVTGGASGIGLALAQALAQEGMNVMLADIDGDALAVAVRDLSDLGLKSIRSVVCDVADLSSMEEAARATFKVFEAVHVVCNNAGVVGGGGVDDISADTWRWVLDVNLMGVLHGVRIFLPHIRAHGKGGHIVNTASMAGLNSGLGFSPYSASKFAVVNMSEGLAMELAPLNIGVTVLCPGFVRTRIWDSRRNRQERYGRRRRCCRAALRRDWPQSSLISTKPDWIRWMLQGRRSAQSGKMSSTFSPMPDRNGARN